MDGRTPHVAERMDLLWSYKKAFLEHSFLLEGIFQALLRKMATPLRYRTSRDSAIIRLLLTLLRNLLFIKDPEVGAHAITPNAMDYVGMQVGLSSSFATFIVVFQDRLINAFEITHILELIVTLAGNIDAAGYTYYKSLVLEILYRVLRDVDVQQIALGADLYHQV